MPSRLDILKWALCGVAAMLLLGGLLALAERGLLRGADSPPAADRGWAEAPGWLTVLPPQFEVEPDLPVRRRSAPPPAAPWVEAPWWRLAWQGAFAPTVSAMPSVADQGDTTQLILARLGLAPDLAAQARPDSVLAARLIWLTRREGYLPREVRPLLLSIGRAAAYRALAARAAEMYDEFLDQEIITTD